MKQSCWIIISLSPKGKCYKIILKDLTHILWYTGLLNWSTETICLIYITWYWWYMMIYHQVKKVKKIMAETSQVRVAMVCLCLSDTMWQRHSCFLKHIISNGMCDTTAAFCCVEHSSARAVSAQSSTWSHFSGAMTAASTAQIALCLKAPLALWKV